MAAPACFIRGNGPQPMTTASDAAHEIYPTCFQHTYQANTEVVSFQDAAALLAGSPQAGVTKVATTTAIGRVIDRATCYNGSSTAVTTFAYDDFGPLLEATTPEVGRPTRYEYDVGDRPVRRRDGDGDGAAEVTTTAYSYDSLGRTTRVAHDLEHTVNRAGGAPAGTPIQDEEYTYDGCATADRPAGVACANALGQRTISRAIEQCGTAGDVIKRGRWYDYDVLGRVHQVAYATTTGAVIGAPTVMTYDYDDAGRVQAYTSPLNAAFGTHYAYGASNGTVTSLSTTTDPGTPIAHNLTYRVFGTLTGYVTASTQPVTGGTRTLAVANHYGGDDTLIGLTRSYVGDAASSIDLMQQTLSYTPAGLLQHRADAGDVGNARHYGYDALQRLTCELRGTGSAADCTSNASGLAGLFRYGNGESAGSPADARLSAVRTAPGGAAGAITETYSYAGGAGRPLAVARGDGDIVIGYDGLGRRVFDEQAVGSTSARAQSRRSYTYELFWDDFDRLIAASIDGLRSVRWSYHYAGGLLVAATREIVDTTTTDVKRFWPVADERGLIFRMVVEEGATHWQAHWDSTAWRSIEGAPQPDMWVPFGLAGQLIMEGTEASPDASATATLRPAIVLNRLRAYDPLFGGFLQPDPADQSARFLPEGYLLARGDYLGHVDDSGAASKIRDAYKKLIPEGWELRLSSTCMGQEATIQAAIDQAIAESDKCHYEKCGAARFAANLKKQWIFAMLTGLIYCPHPLDYREIPQIDITGWMDGRVGPDRSLAMTVLYYKGRTLGDRITAFGAATPCLKRSLAHEAMHGVYKTLPLSMVSIAATITPEGWDEAKELYYGKVGDWTWNEGGTLDEDDDMDKYLDTCINCGKK